jgi:hypothetical protein
MKMFCPSCGTEDRQRSQFCRACGADLRPARSGMEGDSKTSSHSAREEIGRSIAAKIKSLEKTKDLEKVVNDILPEVNKFLETDEERRLRRIRFGVITTCIGVTGIVFVLLLCLAFGDEPLPMIGLGLLLFLIGLGIVINGLLYSVPKGRLSDYSRDTLMHKIIDSAPGRTPPVELAPPRVPENISTPEPISVTEHTTHQLANDRVPPTPHSARE